MCLDSSVSLEYFLCAIWIYSGYGKLLAVAPM